VKLKGNEIIHIAGLALWNYERQQWQGFSKKEFFLLLFFFTTL
jgi:hypothetical protein